MNRVVAAERRVKADKAKVLADLRRLQKKQSMQLGLLGRLEAQEELLGRKAAEMARRGFESLDEMQAAGQASGIATVPAQFHERVYPSPAVADPAAAVDLPSSDPAWLQHVDLASLDWGDLGSVGGTAEQTFGNS